MLPVSLLGSERPGNPRLNLNGYKFVGSKIEQLEFSVMEEMRNSLWGGGQSVIHGVTADECHLFSSWALVKEFRILMPLEVDEYYRGQLFAVSETSRNETGGGDGVLILENDDFTSTTVRPGHSITGIYTHKIYYTKSKSPWALRKIFPDAAFVLHEECWNAFPYCKTVIKNPDYMKDAFYIIIESMHLPDKGNTENDITPETDVREFKSKKTGREKLSKDWIETTKPVMCCYKVVQVHFKMFGFQTMVEHILQRQYPRIFAKFNRELYCWTDRWYDMTIEDIKKMEREMVEELKKKIAEPERRGIVCDVGEKSA